MVSIKSYTPPLLFLQLYAFHYFVSGFAMKRCIVSFLNHDLLVWEPPWGETYDPQIWRKIYFILHKFCRSPGWVNGWGQSEARTLAAGWPMLHKEVAVTHSQLLGCYTVALLHCTVTLHCYTALIHLTVTLNCYTALLHCTVTLNCYTALLH